MIKTWCQLRNSAGGGVGLLRGSITHDRIGTFNGDLIVATTSGYVFRVQYGDANCAGYQQLYSSGVHLEGLAIVPTNPSLYGPMAGAAIAGAEDQRKLHVIYANKTYAVYSTGSFAIEDLDIILPNHNFFGVNYGTANLLGIESTYWTPHVNKVFP